MRDIVIRVENLGKMYRIGKIQQRHDTLRDSLADTLRTPLKWFQRNGHLSDKDTENIIWALKDVSFEIRCGEVVGFIGRNGAGKSTLLKILSRITEPSKGRVMLNGRIGSLLEVGTGFHQELTGRENIYLNGAILGMTRTEIDHKFDEIVAFSEIEKFLDTPVKRFSSGMYVRLAFAVAAYLEPEILLVDEVLAVGDVMFQRKCLDKMQDVAQGGRTVVFVSHNMATVSTLCTRAILMEQGHLQLDANANKVIGEYLSIVKARSKVELKDRKDRAGDQSAYYTDVWFEDNKGRQVTTALTGQALRVHLKYETDLTNPRLNFGVSFYNSLGIRLINCNTRFSSHNFGQAPSRGSITCTLSRLPLPAGVYQVNLWIDRAGFPVDHVIGAAQLEVEGGDFYGTGVMPDSQPCDVFVDHNWSLHADAY